jgi:hypothetical protein
LRDGATGGAIFMHPAATAVYFVDPSAKVRTASFLMRQSFWATQILASALSALVKALQANPD